MLTFSYTPIANTGYRDYSDERRIQSIVPHDDLKQLLHQIQLSILVAENIKFQYFQEWHYPENLKPLSLEDRPTYTECCIFITVLKKFSQLIRDNFKMLSMDSSSSYIFLNTVISVDKNYLGISYKDATFIKSLKQELEKEKLLNVQIN